MSGGTLTSASPDVCAAIAELATSYIDAVDERDMDGWVDLFAADASYQVVSRSGLDDGYGVSHILDNSKSQIEDRLRYVRTIWGDNFNDYRQRHITGPPLVQQVGEDDFDVTMNVAVFITEQEPRADPSFIVGVYCDRVVRCGDRFRYRRKQLVLDTEVLPRSLIYPV